MRVMSHLAALALLSMQASEVLPLSEPRRDVRRAPPPPPRAHWSDPPRNVTRLAPDDAERLARAEAKRARKAARAGGAS